MVTANRERDGSKNKTTSLSSAFLAFPSSLSSSISSRFSEYIHRIQAEFTSSGSLFNLFSNPSVYYTNTSTLSNTFIHQRCLPTDVHPIEPTLCPKNECKMSSSTPASACYVCLIFLSLCSTILANSILAFAPVTALANYEGLNPRQLGGACPASTQTSCADHLGCCPIGAACTYSMDIPVCDESCNGGPNCPNGGCCQAGYICGTTNDFCTPAPTKKPAPPATAKKDDHKKVVDDDVIITTTDSSAPLSTSDPGDDGPRITTPARTPTVSSFHHSPVSSTSHNTTSTFTAGDGTKYVGNASGSNKKSPSQSAQATSSGAATLSFEVTTTPLMTLIIGWIAGLLITF